jgi:hypothetical protein
MISASNVRAPPGVAELVLTLVIDAEISSGSYHPRLP